MLDGVAATSAGDAWRSATPAWAPYLPPLHHADPALERQGRRRVPSPNPSIGSVLYAVTAASAGNAWAVGYTPAWLAAP